jgi:glycosyltransferase involved in cell wall biosynthesis
MERFEVALLEPGNGVLLTIVIPTFDRNDAVIENVSRLLPQIRRPDVELVVLDNCSETPLQESLSKAFGQGCPGNMRVVRNIANIGLIGNSLRALEMGTGDFIWTLCDDDLVTGEAVHDVLSAIGTHQDSVYLWFPVSGGPVHRRPGTYSGFRAAVKAEPNLFFCALSSSVFRRSFFVPRLRYGYLYASTWLPFICPLISEIDDERHSVAILDRVVAVAANKTIDAQWSKLDVCLAVRSLLDMPMSEEAHRYLRISIESFSFSTARLFLDSVSVGERMRWNLFRTFVRRRYGGCSARALSWLLLSQVSLIAPGMVRLMIRCTEKIVRRPLLVEVEDRFSRS